LKKIALDLREKSLGVDRFLQGACYPNSRRLLLKLNCLSAYLDESDKLRNEVLDWVFPPLEQTSHTTVRDKLQDNETAGSWLVAERTFLDWETADGAAGLWLQGGGEYET
jgi:hypothetical protein